MRLWAALFVAGCGGPEEAPAEARDLVQSPAMDGLPTFSLEPLGAERFVTAVAGSRGNVVVSEQGVLARVESGTRVSIAFDVLPNVATCGDVVAFSRRGTTADRRESADVHVAFGDRVRRLTGGMNAALLAVSPGCDEVAFLSPARGLPAIWTVPVQGGAPRQLTNRDLERVPGRAPPGFVPPPRDRNGVRWDADTIEIAAADGVWRIDARSGEVLARP